MKWLFISFLFIGSELQANIFIRAQALDPVQFKEIVQSKQGQSLSVWLADKALNQTKVESLLNLGEKFLRAELKLNQFLMELNHLTDSEMPNAEWRQALIDIFLKKNELSQTDSPEIWDQICYFYHLDEKVQERWPQFHQRCKQEKIATSSMKPSFLKNDLIYIDGVQWKNKISLYQRKVSNPFAIQIRIYSDAEVPVQMKTQNLSLVSISRTPLIQGECGKVQFSAETLTPYEIPLLQVFSVTDITCVEPVMKTPNQESTTWKKDNKWFWLAGIVAGGFLINELKDKELSFEWP